MRPSLAHRAFTAAVLACSAAAVLAGCGAGHSTSTSTAPAAAPSTTSTAAPLAASTSESPSGLPAAQTPQPSQPSATPKATADPHNAAATPNPLAPAVTSAAWLTPAQLPTASGHTWSAAAPISTTNTMLSQDMVLPMCNPPVGADLTGLQRQSFTSPTGQTMQQFMLLYPTPAAAHAAYQQVLSSNRACQAQSRSLQSQAPGAPQDAVITQTGAITAGTAWDRSWTAVHGTAVLGTATDHMYAVQRGVALTITAFTQTATSPAYDTAHDTAFLTTIAADLAVYGTPDN